MIFKDGLAGIINNTSSNAVGDFARQLLERALIDNASDIHIEPFEKSFQLRLRTPVGLKTLPAPDVSVYNALARHFKLLAKLDIAQTQQPQDGKFTLELGGGKVEFRISTLPTLYGESVVLRVLDQNRIPLNLEDLGLPEKTVAAVKQALELPFGLITVVGPTGSGKTTTLYACLRALSQQPIKIVSIEDPIEYALPHVQQASVANQLGYPEALRAFLRHDPDVIFVGEIRDKVTARLAIQAALTGHLVLSTLHTRRAADVVGRLYDLGIERALIASALKFVLAQELTATPQGTRSPRAEWLTIDKTCAPLLQNSSAPQELMAYVKDPLV